MSRLFSSDHKIIGLSNTTTASVFMLIGFSLMMLMRWQLAFPGTPVPVVGGLLGPDNAPGGVMAPEFYNQLGAMHGTIMIFLAVVPLAVGGLDTDDGVGRGQHEGLHARSRRELEQGGGDLHVGAVHQRRPLDRAEDRRLGREVDDGVQPGRDGAVAHGGFVELPGHRAARPASGNGTRSTTDTSCPPGTQLGDDVAADEPGAARDEDAQRPARLRRSRGPAPQRLAPLDRSA